jgi:hypothetical protein
MPINDRGYIVAPSMFVPVGDDLIEGDTETAWMPATNEPQRQVPFKLAAVVPFVAMVVGAIVPFETDEFAAIRQPSEPVRVLARAVDEGDLARNFEPIENPLPFDWYVQPTEPQRQLPRAVDEGGLSWLPEPEDTQAAILTRWWQPASEPVRIKPRLIDEGMLARAPPTPGLFLPPLPGPISSGTVTFTTWRIIQSKAEPVFVPPAAVDFIPPQTPDAVRPIRHAVLEGGLSWVGPLPPIADVDWLPATNEPQRQLPRAVDVGAFIWPTEFPPIADRDWFQPTNEPVRLLPRAVDVGLVVTAPFNPTNDGFLGWHPATNEPVRVLPRAVDVGAFRWPTELPPITDRDWFQPTNEPVRLLPRAVDVGAFIWPTEFPPIADRDWFQPTNEPQRQLARAVDAGLVVTGPFNPTSLDFLGWWRPASEPQRGLPPFRPQPDATQVEILPATPALFPFGWWRQTDEPGRPLPRLVDVGEIVTAPFNPTSLDFLGWLPATNEPVRLLPRLVDEGLFRFPTELPPIADRDWFQPTNEPVRLLPRAVDVGAFVWPPELPPVQDRDWLPPTNEPVRTLPRAVDAGLYVTGPFNPTSDGFLGWLPAPNEPQRSLPPLRWQPDATQVEILPAADVDAFRWWVQPSEPVRLLPRLVTEGGLTFVGELPPIADVDWLPATNEPVRTLARALVEGGLTFVVFDPTSENFLAWWRQPVERPRVLPRAVDVGQFVQDLTQPILIPDFGWFRPASEPTRRVAPLRPQFSIWGQEPIVAAFDWWRPAGEPVRTLARPVDLGWHAWRLDGPQLPPVEGIFRQPEIPVLPIWTGAHLWVPPVQVEELPEVLPDIFQPLPIKIFDRLCAPTVFSTERWPYQFNKFVISDGLGIVNALDPFPAPSSGGAEDPAIDPREPNLRRHHEWNL